MNTKPLWLIGAAALGLLFAHARDVGVRDSATRQFLSDRSRGMSQIAENYGVAAGQCGDERATGLYALGAAFLTIETLATPRLEGWLRSGLVLAAGAMGTAPNISIGPGRIRPGTARAALRQAATGSNAYAGLSEPDLARALLQSCGALHVAIAILDEIRQSNGVARAAIDRDFVRLAAAIYNGQAGETASLEGRFSAEVYLDLVYDAYQYYRFRTLAASPKTEAVMLR